MQYFEQSTSVNSHTIQLFVYISLERKRETIMDFDDCLTEGGEACQMAGGQTVDYRGAPAGSAEDRPLAVRVNMGGGVLDADCSD